MIDREISINRLTSQIEQLDHLLAHARDDSAMVAIPANRVGGLADAKEVGRLLGNTPFDVPDGDACIVPMAIMSNGQDIGIQFVPGEAGAHALLSRGCKMRDTH